MRRSYSKIVVDNDTDKPLQKQLDGQGKKQSRQQQWSDIGLQSPFVLRIDIHIYIFIYRYGGTEVIRVAGLFIFMLFWSMVTRSVFLLGGGLWSCQSWWQGRDKSISFVVNIYKQMKIQFWRLDLSADMRQCLLFIFI